MTDPETRATYDTIADRYRERNADRSTIGAIVEQFIHSVERSTETSPARIVDVGCGPGWESATFAERGHETVGVDLTPEFLRMGRDESPTTSFLRMDMRQLGLQTDAFDGLWACASFLHVPRVDAPSTLSEFHRVVRPGGVVHISVKCGDGTRTVTSTDDGERRFTLYQPSELKSLLQDSGFDVESVDTDETERNTWIQLDARVRQ